MKGGCTTIILKDLKIFILILFLRNLTIFYLLTEYLATSGIEPDLTAHEAVVTTFTPYRLNGLYLLTLSVKHYTNKETRTLKGLLPLLLKRRLFTKFQHVRGEK